MRILAISLLESLILGLVQGITEFLPISSSGHLVILQNLFGISEPQLLFDVLLHVGTLAAIVVIFRRDIGGLFRAAIQVVKRKAWDRPEERLLIAIAAGCVPTALIGLLFSEQFERLFASMTAAGIGLLITGLLLMATHWKTKREPTDPASGSETVSLVQALAVGIAQGFAITPGVSRSGSTIAVALLLGMPRELAARFSFLLAIPAILGALVFEQKSVFLNDGLSTPQAITASMAAGTLVAAVSGIVALLMLLRVVKRGRLFMFAYYCWVAGILALSLGIVRDR